MTEMRDCGKNFSRYFFVAFICVSSIITGRAQETFPENGVDDPRHGHYAFTKATLVKDGATTITDATLVIRDGKIVAVGKRR